MSDTTESSIRQELEKKHGSLNLNHHLSQFTGTEHYYKLTFVKNVLFTDGLYTAATDFKLFWLMDMIATTGQSVMRREDEDIVFMKLHRPDLSLAKAVFTISDGNDTRFHSQVIEFTDFPYESFDFWMSFDGKNFICYLPTEH